jgi:hypothetical protein
MTSNVGRLYAVAIAILVFVLTWTAVAARPWATATKVDPRLRSLAAREQRIRLESAAVTRIVHHGWAVYRRQLVSRRAQIATAQRMQAAPSASPSVRVVTLPPLTITRTS